MIHTIKQPRWHDRVVLIAEHKIARDNVIRFTEAPTMPGDYTISGEHAKSFPLEKFKTRAGGVMPVRAIPLSVLEPLEEAGE